MSGGRLLILSYYYPPLGGGGVHRVLGFTRHLPALGWPCTVICAGEEDYWVKDETLAIPEGTEVLRVHGGSALSAWLKWRRGSAAGRRSGTTFGTLRRLSDWWLMPDSYAGWARRAAAVAARRLERGDVTVLLSTSPPDSVHLAARPLARRYRVPWVADFRDPWIGLHFRTPPTAWHRARHAALERLVVTGADAVLAASRTHADQLAAAFPERAGRVHHLPNGFEPSPLRERAVGGELDAAGGLGGAPASASEPGPPADAATDPDKFLVAFTGTLAQMPDAPVFLDAVHELLARRPEARRRLRVRFAGPYETGIEDRAIALGLKGIVDFPGPVPHRTARELQRRADLLLLWKPRGVGYRTMVPGKLYEYLESGRPILAALEPSDEAARLAVAGGATLVPPGAREPMREALERAYASWREGGRSSGRRPAWLEEHTRAALARRLSGILSALAGR